MSFYRKHFIAIELAISILAAAVLVLVIEQLLARNMPIGTLTGNRQALYTALASAGGSLLGFILTSVSIVVVFGQLRIFDLIRSAGQYEELFRVYFHGIGALAAATLWALAGLVVDTDRSPQPLFTYLMIWLVLLSALRVWRCVWLLQYIVRIAGAARTAG
jgi:hypothetical protein